MAVIAKVAYLFPLKIHTYSFFLDSLDINMVTKINGKMKMYFLILARVRREICNLSEGIWPLKNI